MQSDLFYWIAISQIKGIGPQGVRKILEKVTHPKAFFEQSEKTLKADFGISQPKMLNEIFSKKSFEIAEKQILFVEKHKLKLLHFQDKNYPKRLTHCPDAPIVLYQKGDLDLNKAKVISIVGTRKATDYGKKWCKSIIEQLKSYNALIVSGLAYGADVCAHLAALEYGLPTAAVLAHGLHMIYPAAHKKVAKDIIVAKGALITEFTNSQNALPGNFISRNRIIAGLADATIVVESSKKGGAMVTAQMANSYNREVFAIPGNLGTQASEGTNHLIKTNQAALLTDMADIEYLLNWNTEPKPKQQQQIELAFLEPDEQALLESMPPAEAINIDVLAAQTGLAMNKLSVLLLNLEFKAYVQSLPGKMYKRIN